MARKYPAGAFFFFVLTNFIFRFFWLFLPGAALCLIGIRVQVCLWIGLGLLALDGVLSIAEQLRIRKAALTESDNPAFNELMDAFCSPGGLEAVGQVLDKQTGKTETPEE